jgi:3-phosphoshikimate 1-carboxyvinyltransferase
MKVTIKRLGSNNSPSGDRGNVHAPASKSSMQRACAAALVRKGESIIRNPGKSNDDKAGLNVIQTLGAEVYDLEDGSLKIISEGVDPVSNAVNNGEAGLGIRMFTPLVALSKRPMLINGEGSLLTRPMDFFDEIMPQLGVEIASNKGKLPIKIKGPLQPGNIEIDGSLSSQFLTGLLLAYAALDAKNVTIKVNNLKSKPYVDLTLNVMESFLLKVPENRNYEAFYFDETPSAAISDFVDYTVEGDWSGGAFLLVFGAIAGNIKVAGLDIASTQADKKILEALESCGAQIMISEKEIDVSCPTSGNRGAFEFDATDCPDLFPPLAALAACCNGTTKITGVHRLAHKESNRALTIQEELGKMNIKVALNENVMEIVGTQDIKAAVVHSHHDHRIAMMCALLALKANGETTIEVAEAINKSYPDFYTHLRSLGVDIKTGN